MAVIWGIPYLLIKIAVGQLSPASLVFARTAIGAALLLPVAAARGWLTPLLPDWRWVLVYTIVEVSLATQPGRSVPSVQVLMAVLTLAVMCTALGFLLFFALISEAGPVRATVITYFNPAVALVLGVILLDEPFTVGAVVGFSLILVGSVLATRRTSALAGRAPAPSSGAWGAAARYRRERRHRSQG